MSLIYDPSNLVKPYPKSIGDYNDFDYLIDLLKEDLKRNERSNLDFISLVMGGEGTGKSTFSINVALRIDPNFDLRRDVILFPRHMDARICRRLLLDPEQRRKLKTIVIDEGSAYYNKFRQTSSEGYNVFLDLVLGREYKFHYLWNVQNPADVGLVIREGRFNRIFYTFYDKSLKRYVALIKKNAAENKLIPMFEHKRLRKAIRRPYTFLNKILKVGDYIIFEFPDLDPEVRQIYLKIKQLNLLTIKFIRVWNLNSDDLFYSDMLANMLYPQEKVLEFGEGALPLNVYNKLVELSRKLLKIAWLIGETEVYHVEATYNFIPLESLRFPKLFIESLLKIYKLRDEINNYGIRRQD